MGFQQQMAVAQQRIPPPDPTLPIFCAPPARRLLVTATDPIAAERVTFQDQYQYEMYHRLCQIQLQQRSGLRNIDTIQHGITKELPQALHAQVSSTIKQTVNEALATVQDGPGACLESLQEIKALLTTLTTKNKEIPQGQKTTPEVVTLDEERKDEDTISIHGVFSDFEDYEPGTSKKATGIKLNEKEATIELPIRILCQLLGSLNTFRLGIKNKQTQLISRSDEIRQLPAWVRTYLNEFMAWNVREDHWSDKSVTDAIGFDMSPGTPKEGKKLMYSSDVKDFHTGKKYVTLKNGRHPQADLILRTAANKRKRSPPRDLQPMPSGSGYQPQDKKSKRQDDTEHSPQQQNQQGRDHEDNRGNRNYENYDHENRDRENQNRDRHNYQQSHRSHGRQDRNHDGYDGHDRGYDRDRHTQHRNHRDQDRNHRDQDRNHRDQDRNHRDQDRGRESQDRSHQERFQGRHQNYTSNRQGSDERRREDERVRREDERARHKREGSSRTHQAPPLREEEQRGNRSRSPDRQISRSSPSRPRQFANPTDNLRMTIDNTPSDLRETLRTKTREKDDDPQSHQTIMDQLDGRLPADLLAEVQRSLRH